MGIKPNCWQVSLVVRKIGGKNGGGVCIFTCVHWFSKKPLDFPGGAENRNLPVNAGNTGSISGPGGSHMPQGN